MTIIDDSSPYSRFVNPDVRLRLLDAAVDQAGEAIIVLEDEPNDVGRRVVYVNRAFTRMTGYAAREIVGQTLYLLKGPRTNQDALNRIAAAFDAGETIREEILNYRKDGTTFWADCTIAPVEGSEEDGRFWVSIQRDVTDVKAARDRVRESEARYRALLNHYPHGAILLYDHDLRYLLAGGQGLAAAGLDADEMIGSTVFDVFPTDVAETIAPGYRAALEGEVVVEEVVFRGRTYLMYLAPIRADDGTVTSGLVVTMDITSRKQAEMKLRASESRFRLVAENMRDLVALHTPDGACEWVSPSVEQMLGYAPPEFVDLEPYDLIHPDDRDRVREMGHEPVFDGAPDTRVTYRIRHCDGSYLWVESIVRPVRDDDGRVIKLQVTTRDATERKQYEADILAARDRAEEMSRLKSAFLANMSHEVRTPLTNVIGFADVLAGEVGEDQQEFIRLIQDGSRRLLRTLDSVLDFAQLESQSIRLNPTPVDVCDLVHETARLFRPDAERRGLELTTDVDCPEPVAIQADRGALERVFNNLISNALKFTDTGGVHVAVRPMDDAVEVVVEDTGVGIDSAFVPHIFEPFKQESTGFGRSFEGAGLGLSITRHLVDLHDGSIAVDSEKGEGTAFTVTLPR